jgi:hypothetical protein
MRKSAIGYMPTQLQWACSSDLISDLVTAIVNFMHFFPATSDDGPDAVVICRLGQRQKRGNGIRKVKRYG